MNFLFSTSYCLIAPRFHRSFSSIRHSSPPDSRTPVHSATASFQSCVHNLSHSTVSRSHIHSAALLHALAMVLWGGHVQPQAAPVTCHPAGPGSCLVANDRNPYYPSGVQFRHHIETENTQRPLRGQLRSTAPQYKCVTEKGGPATHLY